MRMLITYIACLSIACANAQDDISKLLKKYNLNNVPYITIEQLASTQSETIVLDAREPSEFEVSHLQNAFCVGYDNFDIELVKTQFPNKNQHIIVYCSIGVRSEVIAKQLIDAGYTNVNNLFGGIFEWKNSNRSVYNSKEKETDSIHAYSKAWSKWLTNGIKVYE